MKRFLSLVLAMACLVASVAFAADDSADYTVAGKLLKQLWAGNGFSVEVTLDVAAKEGAQTFRTLRPVQMGVDYIYVRPTAANTAEHRADITLADGDSALSAAHLQWKDGALSAQADVVGPEWYSFAAGTETATQTAQALDGAKSDLLLQTGMPALSDIALKAMAALNSASLQSKQMQDALEGYLTHMDLWIEGYRQSAVLGKLEDGTVTMQVKYVIAPAAVKAQVKQMVLDLLSDPVVLPALQEALDDETAQLLLNPKLQSHYFSAVDALPLVGDMTLERTVSLAGDTLALHLSLPLYDKVGGAVTLRYDRTRGEGDLPDDNTISVESDVRLIRLTYQEYSSMTDVRVVQGQLISEPKGATAFDMDAGEGQKTLAADFTLRQQSTQSKDDEGREVYGYNAMLTLSPGGEGEAYIALPETEATLEATFASKELKSAATEMNVQLVVGGEGWDQTVTLTANGRTRKKWTPDKLPAQVTNVRDLTQQELTALLPGVALRTTALLAPYVEIPETQAAEPQQTAEPLPATEPAA